MLSFESVDFGVPGRCLLKKVSFQLPLAGCTALLGHNGAGKTLSLMLAHGLLQPQQGSVRWVEAASSPRARAMVLHQPVLLRRSVQANVAYPLALRGIPSRQRRQRTEQALEDAQLSHLANFAARSCSAGERQRIALAQAWICRPQALLLDEPTTNLDTQGSLQIEKMLREIINSHCKVLLTTHDWSQARRLASDVLLLKQGQLLQHCPAKAFFRQHTSPHE